MNPQREKIPQVVEAELQRIPRALLRGHSQELWSIVYMPQASTAPTSCASCLALFARFVTCLDDRGL